MAPWPVPTARGRWAAGGSDGERRGPVRCSEAAPVRAPAGGGPLLRGRRARAARRDVAEPEAEPARVPDAESGRRELAALARQAQRASPHLDERVRGGPGPRGRLAVSAARAVAAAAAVAPLPAPLRVAVLRGV